MQLNARERAIRAAKAVASVIRYKPNPEQAKIRKAKAERLENALFESARTGKTKRITRLLNAGVSIEARSAAGTTPLMFASSNGRAETVSLLLERGAKIDAINGTGMTSLMLAAEHGQAKTALVLLANGAEFKTANGYWATRHYGMPVRHKDAEAILDAAKLLESIMNARYRQFALDFAECADL